MKSNKNKKTVGIVLNSPTLSGAEKRLLRIFTHFNAAEKLEVRIFIPKILYEKCLHSEEFEYLQDSFYDKKIFLYSNPPLSYKNKFNVKYRQFLQVISLWKQLLSNPVDLLQITCGSYSFFYVIRFFLPMRKYFIEITSPDITDSMGRYLMKKWLLSTKTSFIYFVSKSTLNRFKNKLDKNELTVFENKSDCAPIPFYNIPSLEFQKKENVITYASRFIERKNPIMFAQATANFLKKHSDWKLYMLGGGVLEEQVNDILKESIANDQAFVGRLLDIYPILHKSKIYVSVIIPDNFPSQSIMEAMATKNALLCNDIGQTKKFINGKNGVLINDLSADTIEASLEALIEDDDALIEMGVESRKHLEQDFRKEIYLKKLLNIYNNLLSSG